VRIKEFLKFKNYQAKCRQKRAEVFKKNLIPTEKDRVLDLGGEDGLYINRILPFKRNVCIADINREKLKQSAAKGYKVVHLDGSGRLPFPDQYFDIIFCSSVIEHVTGDKTKVKSISSNKEFKKIAWKQQQQFAAEIRRVGNGYFVQTPYKYFLLESHSRLPVILVLLTRRMQIKLIKLFNKFWFAKTSPDWNLLTIKDMKKLFPDALIVKERVFIFTKSLMAIKTREKK